MNPILLDFPDSFETERLIIRAPHSNDGSTVFKAVTETLAELRAWPASLPWALAEPSIDNFEAYCRNSSSEFIARTSLPMLMFSKETNIFIGAVGLHHINWSVPKFEVGYWCRKQFQNQGFITEAISGITQFAFENLGANRIECLTDEENKPSRRVLEKAGYIMEGIMLNERITAVGDLRNTCIYAVTK